MNLEKFYKSETVSSLELLEEINFWRKKESKNSEKEKAELRHDTLLGIIRDEFEEEISLQKILESEYKNERGRKYPKFELTLNQAKQVLLRESKTVRRAVINYIEKLEEALKERNKTEWLENRSKGKFIRRAETDAIQEKLIPLAIKQGSKNYSKLYMTYSRLVNSICEIEPNQRENLKDDVLMYVSFIEDFIQKTIIEEVNLGTNYKDVYKICKIKCETLKTVNPPRKDKYIIPLLEN